MLSKEDIQYRKKLWDDTLKDVRQFFVSRGFEEFQTPLLVGSPGMEPNLEPFGVDVNIPGRASLPLMKGELEGVSQKSAGPPLAPPSLGGGRRVKAGLITSPEYSMKKLLGAGFEKIFTITPVFRNNESGKHNTPEFMMLEWYAPGIYQDLMDETEALLQFVLKDETKWSRIEHQNANVDEHGDPHVDQDRYFIKNYPVKEASLARISDDGKYAERFEAFGDGMELCNGFAELTDADEQRRRLEKERAQRQKKGSEVYPIDEELLEAIENIKTPVYGNALGLDRLVMLKYGIGDINDIQIFQNKF